MAAPVAAEHDSRTGSQQVGRGLADRRTNRATDPVASAPARKEARPDGSRTSGPLRLLSTSARTSPGGRVPRPQPGRGRDGPSEPRWCGRGHRGSQQAAAAADTSALARSDRFKSDTTDPLSNARCRDRPSAVCPRSSARAYRADREPRGPSAVWHLTFRPDWPGTTLPGDSGCPAAFRSWVS